MTQFEPEALPRLLAGDRAAITEFVATMTPIIQARVARVLLKGVSRDIRRDVEDHSQDIFAHLFADDAKVLKRYDASHGLSLRNYIGLIAERRVISSLRSSKTNPWRESVSLDDEPVLVCGHGTPETEAAETSSLNALMDELRGTLSDQGWQLFQLLYVQDMSVSDVTGETGLSNDAVYAWRSRLRKAARSAQARLQAGPAAL
ncbi:MAG: hypothetical protein AAFU65_06875 [Pseudomonadota bacterium]